MKLVLGLEIHMHVNTAKKMFCTCDANIYADSPNTHTCPVCLGLPGALPVPNFEAIRKTQLLGMALSCKLSDISRFDRKHYFYPDLPKGYQISQYKMPLCEGGELKLDSGKTAYLERIHLEEDTAKSFHEGGKSLIDFNKSGMPLIEIVTKPCFTTTEDAVDFCKKIHDVVRTLEICEGDMEKGQMRLEANISVRSQEDEDAGILPKYKVEVKNINSFRFMEKAIKYEIKRQVEVINSGQTPIQENRGWDEKKNITVSQREKEEAHDYRYFPEPDIPPMSFEGSYFEELKLSLKKLPWEKQAELEEVYKIPTKNAQILSTFDWAPYTKVLINAVKKGVDPVKASNLLLNKTEFKILDETEFVNKYTQATKTSNLGSDALEQIAKKVINDNPEAVSSYKAGKQSAVEFLVGAIMRETKGAANSNSAREIITALLHHGTEV